MTAIDRSLSGAGSHSEAVIESADVPDVAAEDRALLERLRAGEDSAFGELFARHSQAVRRLAFGLVSDKSEAEDLTAEAFFRVLQAIRRGAGPVDNVRGYLLIVARRVAWEWQTRRRDVPVSDAELAHRAGADPDTFGQSTERNLITRAFTSLPERWRSVLWKVEVEGERPAVVATNFGLSANATAALARRARQGLRAAYLQAHLAADRSGAGCRSVLEKLGAYTAGSIKGSERRRIRAHLTGCASCTSMHDELRDVCSGLRAHAALLAAPLAAVAGWELASAGASGAAAGSGIGTMIKGAVAGAKAQMAIIASSATVIGMLGVVAGPWAGGGSSVGLEDFNGKRGIEQIITGTQPTGTSAPEIALTTGSAGTSAVVPARRGRTPNGHGMAAPAAPDEVAPAAGGYDENASVIYRRTTVDRRTEDHGSYVVVYETTSSTEVNSAGQTKTTSSSTEYTKPAAPPDAGVSSAGEPRTESVPESTEQSVKPTSSVPPTTTPTTLPAPKKGPTHPH
jgi:RNA polymerase sigma factor (sigma-70 family)